MSGEPIKTDPIRTALDSLFERHLAIESDKAFHTLMLDELSSEDARLQPKIVALATALDEEIDPNSPLGAYLTEIVAAGLTEGVRAVLRGADNWLSPTDVRNGLLRLGYDLKGYSNVLASIHTILGRLRKGGEIKHSIKKKGSNRESVFRWNEPEQSEEDEVLARRLKADLDYRRTVIRNPLNDD